MTRMPLARALCIGASLLASTAAVSQSTPPTGPDALADGFANPPDSARPRVWWHWLNGNITEDGITKDLEWMKRAGIGGAQNFDASLGTPQIVPDRLAYMTPPWKHAFAHAATVADRLGLELAIAASPGWSETGGPWVPPTDGMKKLVWSETEVTGGRRFAGRLPAPPVISGPFQDAALVDPLGPPPGDAAPRPGFYADTAVIAFPAPAGDAPPLAAETATGAVDPLALSDGKLATTVDVARGTPEHPAWLALRYARPRTVRSATLFLIGAKPPFGDPEFLPVLEASTDSGWQKVAVIPLSGVPTTVTFAPVTARAFRVTFAPNTAAATIGLGSPAPGAVVVNMFGGAPAGAPLKVGAFRLFDDARVDRVEAKAGFATAPDYYAFGTAPGAGGIDPAQVIDLTGRLKPDGSLDWTPPKGRWRILRLGYSLTGTTNHPATAEGTGLEVDKYDGAAVRRYLETYLANYRSAAGDGMVGAKGVRALVTDSIEAGDSNWTPGLVAAFTRLRGYDPRPFLPALTGVVIGSPARTDAFLYDYRRTLADLITAEHYGTVATVAHEHGLTLYGEALEDGRPLLGDDMAMRAHTDVPMAALWTYNRGDKPRPTLIGDMRGAASVAHIYGQNLVAAESMTAAFSPWAFAPSDLRRIVDLEFASGVNRPVIHTSVHQPLDDKVPGLSLAIFGQYFNRHETWAEMARPWIDYIARSSYLLQQGRNVADIAYFYGEEAPITELYAHAPLADVPAHNSWDFVDPDVLANRLEVEDGALVARSGARYRVLYLGGTSRRMTLPVLKRIAALANDGATVIGLAPESSPSLADDRAAFDAIVHGLWAGGPVTKVGKGRVIAAATVEAGLKQADVAPDVEFAASAADSEILFIHRKLTEGEVYFVDNRKDRRDHVDASFAVIGKAPELWHADTGRAEPVSYRVENGRTIVPLDLDAEESIFVIFRKPASAPIATITAPVWRPIATLSAPWQVDFQPGRGAPASTKMATLSPLEKNTDPGIRYFSGVATYASSFTMPAKAKPAGRTMLDLGEVGDVAEVRVNGTLVGTVWHRHLLLDVTDAVHPGRNRIEVRVANLWVNRLIGDAQPGATKITFTVAPTYRPDAPLRPSGLLGPVTLLAAQ